MRGDNAINVSCPGEKLTPPEWRGPRHPITHKSRFPNKINKVLKINYD